MQLGGGMSGSVADGMISLGLGIVDDDAIELRDEERILTMMRDDDVSSIA